MYWQCIFGILTLIKVAVVCANSKGIAQNKQTDFVAMDVTVLEFGWHMQRFYSYYGSADLCASSPVDNGSQIHIWVKHLLNSRETDQHWQQYTFFRRNRPAVQDDRVKTPSNLAPNLTPIVTGLAWYYFWNKIEHKINLSNLSSNLNIKVLKCLQNDTAINFTQGYESVTFL